MHKTAAVTLIAALGLNACASIVSKSDWPVSIQSEPAGLAFTITNQDGVQISSGKTPQTVTLASGAGYFSSAKYKIQYTHNGVPTVREVKADLNGWYWGNFIFAGLIGFLIVDPLTGAMYRLPENVSLTGTPVHVSGATPALHIVSIDTLSAAQRAQLVRLN